MAGLLAAMNGYWQRFGTDLALHLTGTPESLSKSAAAEHARVRHKHLVNFLGQPTDEELSKQYALAAAFVTLSRAEGFGLPVLEAMAHGCPVLAAACASLPEFVGDAGVLVDPDDVVAVADGIHRITTDRVFRATLVEAGLGRAQRFTWEETAFRFCELYRRVAGEAAVTGRPIRPARETRRGRPAGQPRRTRLLPPTPDQLPLHCPPLQFSEQQSEF